MEPARLNPFRSERTESLAFRFKAGWDWARLIEALAARNWRASIVGPHGSGKTTLFAELAQRLAGERRSVQSIRFNDESNLVERWRSWFRLRTLDPTILILLDGAEQLSGWEWVLWKWQTQRLSGLVITTHSPGRLPCAYRCETSEELLAELVGELDSTLAAGLGIATTRKTYRECAGNLREALRRLYDQRNHVALAQQMFCLKATSRENSRLAKP